MFRPLMWLFQGGNTKDKKLKHSTITEATEPIQNIKWFAVFFAISILLVSFNSFI
jgi:hypothetical protein